MGLLRMLARRLRNRSAKARIAAATASARSGDVDGAIAACREAVALCPDRPWFHDQLALALTHQHEYWFDPSLERRLHATGRLDEAIASWRTALGQGWSSHWTQLCLGHALTSKGDHETAARHLRAATDLNLAARRPEHVARHGIAGTVHGPDFVVIGGTKCGTTSLYEYLCAHPSVLPAVWKEIEYFRFPERGLDWYLAHFPRIPGGGERFVTGEASTCYFAMSEVPERLRASFPRARLIALVRDPVERAISHCHHDRKIGCEQRSVEDALARELDLLEPRREPWRDAEDYWRTERGYVWLGLYAPFLEHWRAVFDPQQLLILTSEELYAAPAATLATVHAHLGLREHRLREYPVHLRGDYQKAVGPLHERLARFFAPHTERLEQLLGRGLPWRRPSR